MKNPKSFSRKPSKNSNRKNPNTNTNKTETKTQGKSNSKPPNLTQSRAQNDSLGKSKYKKTERSQNKTQGGALEGSSNKSRKKDLINSLDNIHDTTKSKAKVRASFDKPDRFKNKKQNKSFGSNKSSNTSKPARTGYAQSTRSKSLLTTDEKSILKALQKSEEGGVQSRPLFRKSGIKSKSVFYQSLNTLSEKKIIEVNNHIVSLIPEEMGIPAKLVSLSSGFGFAQMEDGRDAFIHGSELNGAFLGDSVLLAGLTEREKGLSASIMRVVKRSEDVITGTLQIEDGRATVRPDASIRYSFFIKTSDLNGAKSGDKVMIEPIQDKRGDFVHAKVNAVFGEAENAKVCADAIIASSGIPTDFPIEVKNEVQKVAFEAISSEEIARRLDLRDELIFTIDGADAKDLDDAISVKKTDEGFLLGVHIADVSHYVSEGGALDKEAFRRGTSVYFADRVIPMLPTELSNDACSLNAGTDKLAFSALITFDLTGKMKSYSFQKSVINSKLRGVYKEVNDLFSNTATSEVTAKYEPVRDCLLNARELADLLAANARVRGHMDIESGEIQFILDENGKCIDLKPRTTGEAEELIEQMMISANIAAAKFAQDNNLPFLYRVHENPKAEKVAVLAELLSRLGIPSKEIKKAAPSTADFAAVLEHAKESDRKALISQRVLRTMEKARYSPEELGHFGLALSDYSHFTSPIRRYPDTSIHRILTAFVSGMKPNDVERKYKTFTSESASESSKNEIRAVMAERSAEDCYTAEYMKEHIGEHYTGRISGSTEKGLFVRLENGAEGYVSLSDFQDADYGYDGLISFHDRRSDKTLTVGDPIRIVVASSVISTGRVDFMPEQYS